MKKNRNGRRDRFSLWGALMFFALVASILQISVLIYDYIRDRTDDIGMIAVLMLNVIVILAAICTAADALRRRIMIDRPVGRILAATERIATGDFSVRLMPDHPYGKYTEYDVIMENLNTMATELGKSEILKNDFISNVSHELKTPLAVIRNYAKLLQDATLSPEERQKHAETLIAASTRLSNLITNILRLNKLENREMRIAYQDFCLSELLAECIIGFEEQIERKRISLSCDIAEDVRLRSAAEYIELVLNNLLSNAVKFTEEGGEIAVSMTADEKYAVFSVRDTGCGISPEVGARIFEKFYQGETSHTGEGNGLGLALVRRVIDMLGGEITVKSELGQGSTFTVRLPKNPDEE